MSSEWSMIIIQYVLIDSLIKISYSGAAGAQRDAGEMRRAVVTYGL